MTTEPPVFEERRQLPDRRQGGRRAEDQTRFLRTAVAAAVAISGGLVIIYLFFGAIGAVDFATAAAATIVTAVLAAVWVGGYWFRQRSLEPRGPATFDRERRGF
jgi:hypothetical protein